MAHIVAEPESEIEVDPPRATLVLLILCGAQMLLSLTVTIVLIGGAAVKRSVDIADGDVHWLVTAYALAFGGLVLLAGRIGDRLGHRRLFLTGLGLFGLTSLGVAVSQSTGQIVAARAMQGVAAAIVSPVTLALLTEVFVGPQQRARAFAGWSLAGSTGGVLGYLGGGLVIDSIGWRWAFALNTPLAVAGVAAALVLLPPTAARHRASARFDVLGAATISGAAFALVYGFGRAQAQGWRAGTTLASFAVSVALVLLFLGVERRAAEPLIPLHLIRRTEFSANVITLCMAAMTSGTLLVASLFLQEERGYSARGAGLATLPVPIGVGLGARLTSWLIRRRPGIDPIRIAVVGQVLIACSYTLLAARIGSGSYAGSFLPAWLAMGIGLAMTSIPMVGFATSGVEAGDRGIVSGMFNMSQQLGAALGVAALWTVTHATDAGPGDAVAAARRGYGVAAVVALAAGGVTIYVAARNAGRAGRQRVADIT